MIEASARQAGMTSLFEHGCMAVEQGLTTLEELLRILGNARWLLITSGAGMRYPLKESPEAGLCGQLTAMRLSTG